MNGNQKASFNRIWITVAVTILMAFVAYTVHKIYVYDPQAYAYKIDLAEVTTQAKVDILANRTASLLNEKAIIEMRSNFIWIQKNQEDLMKKTNEAQDIQEKILGILKTMKRENDR